MGGGGAVGGGGGGGYGGIETGLLALPYRTDELGTSGAVLSALTAPASLVSRDNAVYVLAAIDPGCTGTPIGLSVSRFDVTTSGLSQAWTTPIPAGALRANLEVSTEGVTVVGTGALAGLPLQGGADAFVMRIRHDGTTAWVRQFGTVFDDTAEDTFFATFKTQGAKNVVVLADGTTLVAGLTSGSLLGQSAKGGRDAFVVQLAADGTLGWVRLIGSSNDEGVIGLVDLEDGTVALAGRTDGVIEPGHVKAQTSEFFLVRMSDAGLVTSTRQLSVGGYGWVQRWDDDLVWVGGAAEVVRMSANGDVRFTGDWITDGGRIDLYEFVPLDGGLGSFHGLVNLEVINITPWTFDLFEHIWSSDGGVTTTPMSGGWPQVGALLVENPVVGSGPDGTWYVAGSSSAHPVPDNLVTITRQTSTGLGRDALMRFLFDQPPVAQEAFFHANIHPTRLTVAQNGSRVVMGEVKWGSCMVSPRIWLMRM